MNLVAEFSVAVCPFIVVLAVVLKLGARVLRDRQEEVCEARKTPPATFADGRVLTAQRWDCDPSQSVRSAGCAPAHDPGFDVAQPVETADSAPEDGFGSVQPMRPTDRTDADPGSVTVRTTAQPGAHRAQSVVCDPRTVASAAEAAGPVRPAHDPLCDAEGRLRVDVVFPDGQRQQTILRDGEHTEVADRNGSVVVRAVRRSKGHVELHVFPATVQDENDAPRRERVRLVRPLDVEGL